MKPSARSCSRVLSLLHRILARVLPEDANDVDGDREYQLMRARILEDGFTSEYSYKVAGFRTELSRRDCRRVTDILQMFRILGSTTSCPPRSCSRSTMPGSTRHAGRRTDRR